MNRREELRAKTASEKTHKLFDRDYLLGVYDEARMGGLRFKTELLAPGSSLGGARPKQDIEELWKRIVFSMAISNTDDHFRNYGFVLSEKGWILSPLYDVNPDIYGEYLSLNVDDNNSFKM